MTTPTPMPGTAPSTGNSAGAQALTAAGIQLPSTLSSGKSQFGLGTLSGSPVSVGGLLPVLGKDGSLITPSKDGTYTAEQVMQAFASASPAVIAQIQHQLMLGGFYSANGYMPNYGIVNKEDLDAFSKAVQTSAQTGGSLSEYLARQAKFGEYQGVAAAMGQQKPLQIQKADPLQLGALIDSTYKSLTGKKPTDAEKAGFVAAYNAAYSQLQRDNYNAQAAAQTPAVDTTYSTAPVEGGTGLQGLNPLVAHDTSMDSLSQTPDAANLAKEPTAPPTAGSFTQQDFDPQAFADNYVRSHATGQVGGHDAANTFDMFLNILKGIG